MQKRDFINSTFSLKSLMFYITLILISFIVSLKDPLAGILFLNSSLALFLIILVYKAFSFKLFFALALFIGVFWIYHSIYPILFLLDIPRAVDIPFVSYQTVFKSTLLVLLTMIGILISILLITKFVKCHKRFKQINSYKANNTLIVISAIVLFILGFYIYFLGFKSSGYSLKDIFTYYGSSYIRLNLTNMPDYYRLLMYASSVLISSTLFNKKNEKSNNYLIVFFYILVFLYSFFQFGIGNRREVLIILLPFLGIIFKNYFQRFSFRTFFFMLLLLLISFFIFQYFVVVRSGFNLDNFSTKEFIQFSFSSFDGNAPFATICFYVENGVPKYQYGLTYIYNPLYNIIGYFISAEGYILASPAVLFARNYGGGIGWAFSPVTEAYINFGPIGCLLFGIIFSFLLFFFTRLFENSNLYSLSILGAFVINRGDFTGFFTEIVLTGVLVVLVSMLVAFIKPRNIWFKVVNCDETFVKK